LIEQFAANPVPLSGIIVAQASTTSVGLWKIPLAGSPLGKASSRAFLGPGLPTNAAAVDLGRWPVGVYQLKTCARTDATSTPAALTCQVLANWVQVGTSTLYTAGDTVSATYPTTYATYAALTSFNLAADSDVRVQWFNPGTYHAAGKHLWIRAVQLHRLS
jgi:hypothetical protein